MRRLYAPPRSMETVIGKLFVERVLLLICHGGEFCEVKDDTVGVLTSSAW
jgi:hypothetical protein